MPTTTNARSVSDLLEAGRVQRSNISVEEQKEATRRVLNRIERAAHTAPTEEVDSDFKTIARLKPKTIRERGKFWLSQLGAFAEAMLKGRHNTSMAIRAYEMVQSIS